MAIKRLHYFDHQFLVEKDFTDEQAYHIGMRRRVTRVLHTFGITEGLEVRKTGNREVTVKPGVAIDKDGREMVVEPTEDRVLDLSNVTTFPVGATVHVTIGYDQRETDPSTATGAPGNTRITEEPKVEAKTTAPPTDGTVVRLAQFTLVGGNVPGALNDPLDGGVRQAAGARLGPASVAEPNLAAGLLAKLNAPLVSLDGVSNPGGNIDLLTAPGITITPNNAAKTITIGQNVTAAQVGALPANQYELDKRVLSAFQFSQADATGATRSVAVGFQPRLVLAIANCQAFLGGPGGRTYGGGSVGFFESLAGQQRCFGFAMTRISNTDWFTRPSGAAVGLCSALFFDSSVVPNQGESISVTMTLTATGLTATLTRSNLAPAALASFDISVNLFCMGA